MNVPRRVERPQVDRQYARDRARQRARNELVRNHPREYARLVAAELRKVSA